MNDHSFSFVVSLLRSRIPMYLKRSPTILFQILKPKLNLPLKRADERQFIHHRLTLFDRHYCLEVDLKLQQSYLDIGLEQQRWPVSICLRSTTNHSFSI